jgi:hypothetical protein
VAGKVEEHVDYVATLSVSGAGERELIVQLLAVRRRRLSLRRR